MKNSSVSEPKQGGSKNRGNAGKGRAVGSQNKVTRAAKEAFQYAFDKIGGADQLASWAGNNPDEFYKLYSKLIPADTTLSGPDGGPIKTFHQVIVKASPSAA